MSIDAYIINRKRTESSYVYVKLEVHVSGRLQLKACRILTMPLNKTADTWRYSTIRYG